MDISFVNYSGKFYDDEKTSQTPVIFYTVTINLTHNPPASSFRNFLLEEALSSSETQYNISTATKGVYNQHAVI